MWKNHYEKLLNSEELPQLGEHGVNVKTNINTVNLDMLDVEIALSQIKNNRSLGFYKITIEMIKTAHPLRMQRLYRLIKKYGMNTKFQTIDTKV